MGWHLLTEMTGIIGRIRVTSGDTAVAATGVRATVVDLRNQAVVAEEEFRRGIVVGAFDARNDSALVLDARGSAAVRAVAGLAEVFRFRMRGEVSLGCINGGYAVAWGGRAIRVWEIERGQHLYSFRERVEECNALIADERYVAACSDDATIHLWDFGAQ